MKQEPKLELKEEASKGKSCVTPVQIERTIKREAGGSMKIELKSEIKDEADGAKCYITPIRAKVEVKHELGCVVKHELGCVVKREPGVQQESTAEADWGYASRVPLWVSSAWPSRRRGELGARHGSAAWRIASSSRLAHLGKRESLWRASTGSRRTSGASSEPTWRAGRPSSHSVTRSLRELVDFTCSGHHHDYN